MSLLTQLALGLVLAVSCHVTLKTKRILLWACKVLIFRYSKMFPSNTGGFGIETVILRSNSICVFCISVFSSECAKVENCIAQIQSSSLIGR